MVARLKRIGAVARVETLMLLRDRAHLALIFLLPIFQLLLYGYAISLEPKHVTLAIATDEQRLVNPAIDAINSTPILRLVGPIGPAGSAEAAVKAGRAQVGVEVGRDPQTRGVTVKIIADAETDEILGMAVVGPEASDLISEGTLALEMGAFLPDLALTVHPHPTLGEGIMEAAKAALGESPHIVGGGKRS